MPDWWRKLSPKERTMVHRIMGKGWKPSGGADDALVRTYVETRRRIREIERRAIKKLRSRRNDGG